MLVVVARELTDAGAELLERVEAFDPEDLFLERLEELLDDAVGFGLVDEGGWAVEAEVVDFGLVVPGPEAAAAVGAQLQAGGGASLDGPEAVKDRFSEQVGGGPAVHP